MKKQIAGLMTATLISLSIPVSVLAEDMTPTQSKTQYDSTTTKTEYNSQTQSAPASTTTTTQYNSQTQTTPAAASSTDAGQPTVSQTGPGFSNLVLNNQFGYANNEIIIGSGTDASAPMVLPKIHIGSVNTSIKVVNPTSKPVTFTSPDLNLTSDVPANGVRVIQIDKAMTANLTPGQEVAYYVNDTDGNRIASSNFVNNQEIVSMIDVNTQVASTESTEQTATQTTTTQRKSTVRGYW
jgi:hypothetical protein